MADEIYRFIYEADIQRAMRSIDQLEQRIVRFDARVDQSIAKLKTFGTDTPGIKTADAAVSGLEARLKALAGDASAAEAALKEVGKDNRAVGALTARLEKLEAELKEVTAAAHAAAQATAGVGAGGARGGGGRANAGLGNSVANAGRAMARHLAYRAASKVVGAVGDAARDQRNFFGEAADMASDFRSDLKELAVLQGKNGADDALMKEQIAYQRTTGLNAQEAATLRLEFGGAIAPGLGRGNITPQVAKDLEIEAGKFTARYGLDATTGGRMSALLANYGKVPTAASGIGTMAEALEQLNVEGVGPVKGMATHLLSLSGGMIEDGGGGRFKNFPEMAARLAASTVNQAGSAARAKTRIVQSDRLLRKLAYDRDSDLGKKANINPEDDYETAIRKLAPHIAGADGYQKMVDSGYNNKTELLAVIEEAKMNDVVSRSIANPRMAAVRQEAIARNNEFATTPTGKQRAHDNAEFGAMIETGMKSEALKAARVAARARMIRGGTLKANGIISSLKDQYFSFLESAGGVSGEDLRVDEEAVNELRRQGKQYGIDVDKRYPGLRPATDGYTPGGMTGGYVPVQSFRGTNPQGFATQFQHASDEIDAARKLHEAGDAVAKLGQNRANQGGGGGPRGPIAPGPGGNAGAGVVPGRR